MKRRIFAIVVFLVVPRLAFCQTEPTTETFVVARLGQRTVGSTYHLVEVFQVRGRWIYPDVGYIDFADADRYREVFVGGGGMLFSSKRVVVIGEAYLDQGTGPDANGALYFLPWTLVAFTVTPKISGEVVYFPYLPLNDAGRIQHVVERAKLEYNFGRLKVGGGYGAYRFGDNEWSSRPFVTTTLKAGRFGSLELWLQKMPGGGQVQVRYLKIFK